MADSLRAEVGEALLPWWANASSLNKGEDAELKKRLSMAPEITPGSKGLRVTEPAPSGVKSMPDYRAIATRAAAAASKYAPAVIDRAKSTLATVTNNKVTELSAVPAYVGSNANRLKVVTDGLLNSGVMLGDVLPRDLIGDNEELMQIRAGAERLVGQLRAKFQQGADSTLEITDERIAADVIIKRRVKAALQIFGSAENYFLVNPNGGISVKEFAWHDAVIRR